MPEIRSTGGIFLRLDSSGNLNIYDTTGTSIAKFLSGKLSVSGNKGTFVSNAAITSTSSATAVDVGQSVQITPQISTAILVFAYLDATGNSVATNGSSFQIRRSTGTNNPAGGTADSNSNIAFADTTYAAVAANDKRTISLFAIDTTVTVGQAYTYSLAVNATTGGTVSWSLGGIANIGAFEL